MPRRVAVDAIVVKGRHRKDLGDLSALGESIQRLGLLHAIVVTADNRLICGARRLEAWKQYIAKPTIPVNVARNLSELKQVLEAERDENTCRLALSPSEAVALGQDITKTYKPKAQEAERIGGAKGGRKSRKGSDKGRATCPTLKVQDESKRTTAVAAAAAGMKRKTYEKAAAVVKEGDEALIAEMDRTGKVDGAYRKLKRQQAAEDIKREPPPLPRGPFRVIVADPPWRYQKRAGDVTQRGQVSYPTMSLEEIAAMDVKRLAAKDAILWLWVTNAHLPDVWPIVEAWGFQYKTMLTWAKNKMGMGDWLRGKTEHCLMCVRGGPTILLADQTTLLEAKVGRHSQKPDEFYEMVDKLCPGSKIELFQRRPREGWIGHGNEARK